MHRTSSPRVRASSPSPRITASSFPRVCASPHDAGEESSERAATPPQLELFERGSAAESVSANDEPLALIGKLKGLLDAGAITTRMFESKRAELMARV